MKILDMRSYRLPLQLASTVVVWPWMVFSTKVLYFQSNTLPSMLGDPLPGWNFESTQNSFSNVVPTPHSNVTAETGGSLHNYDCEISGHGFVPFMYLCSIGTIAKQETN